MYNIDHLGGNKFRVDLRDRNNKNMGSLIFSDPRVSSVAVQVIDSTNRISPDNSHLRFYLECKGTSTVEELIAKTFEQLIQENMTNPRDRIQVLDFVVAATHGITGEEQIEGKAKYWLAINEFFQEGFCKEEKRKRAMDMLQDAAELGYQPAKVQFERLAKNKNLRVDAQSVCGIEKDDAPFKSDVVVEAAMKNADGFFGRAKVWLKFNAKHCLWVPPAMALVVATVAIVVILAVGTAVAAVAGIVALHMAFPHVMIPLDICLGVGVVAIPVLMLGMVGAIDGGAGYHPYDFHLP